MIYKDLYGQKEEIEGKNFLSYEDIPKETRQKVFFVISENLYYYKKSIGSYSTDDYLKLKYAIMKYKGIQNISDINDDSVAINEWILNCSIVDFLRTIELFIYIKKDETQLGPNKRLLNTINDINDLFKLDKIGYEIVNERIIRKDSEFLHEQVIKQTISLLDTNDFKGPLEEFQKALDHYLVKEYKDTIQEANNSFESTMKSVLMKLRIDFKHELTASKLVDILCDKNIIYPYTKSLFLGLPTIRNNQSGHGQGIDPRDVSQNYAELALNLAGTFIVFLITRYQELNN